MLTEAEAKAKACPFAKVDGSNRWKQSLPADEPWAMNPVGCRCIGSACMAWRWKNNPIGKPLGTEGYCGLAGRP